MVVGPSLITRDLIRSIEHYRPECPRSWRLTVDWCRDQGALLFLGCALVLQAATRAWGHPDPASLNEALAIAKTSGARLIEKDASR